MMKRFVFFKNVLYVIRIFRVLVASIMNHAQQKILPFECVCYSCLKKEKICSKNILPKPESEKPTNTKIQQKLM